VRACPRVWPESGREARDSWLGELAGAVGQPLIVRAAFTFGKLTAPKSQSWLTPAPNPLNIACRKVSFQIKGLLFVVSFSISVSLSLSVSLCVSVSVCVCVCVCVCVFTVTCGGQERALGPSTGVKMVVSQLMWVLGAQFRSSGRIVLAFI